MVSVVFAPLRRTLRYCPVIVAAVTLFACGGDDESQGRNVNFDAGGAAGTSGPTLLDDEMQGADDSPMGGGEAVFPDKLPTARFSLGEIPAGTPLGDIPFPSDIYRDSAGNLDFGFFPQRTSGNLIDTIISSLESETPGFGTTASMYVGFDGPIDSRVLPDGGLASRSDESPLFLVNVDSTSSEYGQRMPLDWRIMSGPSLYLPRNTLGVRPVEGLRLLPNTTYALVVTTNAAKPASGIAVMLADDEPAGGLKVPWSTYAAFREWLKDNPVSVATASVFTTQDPTTDLFKARDFIHTLPPPNAADMKYLGVKNDAFEIFEGTYSAPRFQEGDIPYRTPGTGAIRFDGDVPIVQGTETLRFALSIPTGREMPPEGWPVVLYGHGTGGYYKTFTTNSTKVALVLARAGIAVLSIDQIHHGTRDTSDNPCSEQSDPDSCVSLLFFNFVVPNAGRDNVRQSALDFVSLMRMAQNFDQQLTRTTQRTVNRYSDEAAGGSSGGHAESLMAGTIADIGGQIAMNAGGAAHHSGGSAGGLAEVDTDSGGTVEPADTSGGSAGGGSTTTAAEGSSTNSTVRVKLDPKRIIYMGHSQGGLNGPLLLAIEKDILAGVISAGGASFPISIEKKTKPLDINAVVSGLVPLDKDEVVDRWHPTLTLVQTFIEPGEPANYAAYWFEAPRDGYAPKHILMTAGLNDEYTPPESIFALAAAGRVPIVSPVLEQIALFEAFGIEPAGTPPYSGNVANGQASAGLIQVNNRGHFVIQRDVSVQQRYRQFVRSVFDGNPQIF